MKALHALYWPLLLLACLPSLIACATLGLTTPQTPEQRLYAAYGTAAQAQALATNLLTAKMISSTKAQEVQDASRSVKAALDGYFAAVGSTKPQNAVEVLSAINKGLIQLETFLAERSQK